MIAALNDNHFISKEEQYFVPGFITFMKLFLRRSLVHSDQYGTVQS